MFIDVSLVTQKCDTFLTRSQQCMDYLRDHEDDYHVRRKADLPKCDSEHLMLFHAYWRGLIGRGLIFILRSFIFTQRLPCARYVLWVEGFVPMDVDQVALLVEKERLEDEAKKTKPSVPVNRKYPVIKMSAHYESLLALKKMAPYVEVRRFNLSDQLRVTSGLSNEEWDAYVDLESLVATEKKSKTDTASQEDKSLFSKQQKEFEEKWKDNKVVKVDGEKKSLAKYPRFRWPINLIKPSSELNGNAVTDSDTVRFVLLYNLGGLYVDTDVVFIRDMRPWYYTAKSWSSAWSVYDSYNTALLKANVGDEAMAMIMDKAIANGAKFHPNELLKYLKPKTNIRTPHLLSLSSEALLAFIPAGVFDSTWPWYDGWHEKQFLPNININSGLFYGASQRESEFYVLQEKFGAEYVKTAPIRELRTLERLFTGTSAFHCHGIGYEIEKDSWADILLDHYECFANGLCRNIYNETFSG